MTDTKRPRGRPHGSGPPRKYTRRIPLYVTEEQRTILMLEASDAGIPLSEYIRKRLDLENGQKPAALDLDATEISDGVWVVLDRDMRMWWPRSVAMKYISRSPNPREAAVKICAANPGKGEWK